MHPAARTRRVDPANPGVKADQRTGPESSAAPTIPSCPFFTKKEENKKKKKVTSIPIWSTVARHEKVTQKLFFLFFVYV